MKEKNEIRNVELANSKKRRNRKKKTRKPKSSRETKIVDYYNELGQREVETPLGFIDLLTDKYLIEFKDFRSAKTALGQVISYSHFIRNKKKLIVLFGKGLHLWKTYIVFERLCAEYNIEVYKLTSPQRYKELYNRLKNNE